MSIVVALLLGAGAARLVLLGGRHMFAAPALERQNYRNFTIAIVGGIVLVVVAMVAAATQATLNAFDWIIGSVGAEALVLLTAVGFGFLGLLDDLLGASDTTGFRGHLRALSRGHCTTGMIKLVGGGLLALVVVGDRSSGAMFLVDAAVVALAANAANLLDRRPGRLLKVALLAYVPLALVAGTAPLGLALAPVFGAAIGIFPDDVRERIMLGDTGANALGALLGVGVVYLCTPTARIVTLLVLIALNVASEFVSFTKVIDAVTPLRFVDQLGRRRDG
ncbi:MAG: hypothetical protein ACOYN3_04460 [Acidimicrobiia bacterium]